MSNEETVQNYIKLLKENHGGSENSKAIFRLQGRYVDLVKKGLTAAFGYEIAKRMVSVLAQRVFIKLSSRFNEKEREEILAAIVEHTLSNVMSMYNEGIPIDAIPYHFVTNYELTDN